MKNLFILAGWFLTFTSAMAGNSSDPEVCGPGSEVFTANGEKVDLKSLYGLHITARALKGICQIEIVEGMVWWRAGQVTAITPADASDWMLYKVAFGFLMSPEVNKKDEAIRGLLRTPEWEGVTLNLTRYPGLQIRLSPQNHPDQPAGFKGNFVMEKFQGGDGRRKLINCSAAATSLAAGKGRAVKNLTVLELADRDFSQDYDLCEMDLLDFSLESGAGRITFSTKYLNSAAMAIPAIFDYIKKASLKKGV
ncbi:hypothetical protein NLO72_22110 [Pseudomonas tremae]|uniref:hypothetical protein n=1 Tax=Pseudomonas tremae TaxID=200454 RepID=UPI00210A2D81|nr:hypothetical protein [Pseudomonas tremae]MCQ2991901.1 hypothetical protein [Pseudomonas tremae]